MAMRAPGERFVKLPALEIPAIKWATGSARERRSGDAAVFVDLYPN
jgi:hypothetical protein